MTRAKRKPHRRKRMRHLLKGMGMGVVLALAFTLGVQSQSLHTEAIRYLDTLDEIGRFNGELIVLVPREWAYEVQDPTAFIWNSNDEAWEEIGGDPADLVVTSLTTTGDVTVGGTLSGGTWSPSSITATGAITAGTSFIIGSADITETELEQLDGVTAGTVSASKVVVVDASKNITGYGTWNGGAVTSSGILTGTALTAGSAVLAESELEFLDGITAGTAAASKAVVLDSSGNIASMGTYNGGALTASTLTATTTVTSGTSTDAGTVLSAGSGVTVGNAILSEAELETIDGITPGTAAASKAVVLDASSNIASLGTIDSGAITTSGTLTANADVILGDDEDDTTTINSTPDYNVYTSDFEVFSANAIFSEDFGTFGVTDGAENIVWMPGQDIGFLHMRIEAPDGPGLAGTCLPVSNGFIRLGSCVDNVDDEGIDIRFGAHPDSVGGWQEESLNTNFCEIDLKLADISDTDAMYFGYHAAQGYTASPASWASYNTYAFFVLSDNAGDLDIVTELNGTGTNNDDTGVTWADAETKTLRIELSPDSVEFFIDGVTVAAQSAAVLDADDADNFVCGFGYVVAAGDLNPIIDYVTMGNFQ
jgi:hypothetical protein